MKRNSHPEVKSFARGPLIELAAYRSASVF
jgi:hypothetical protein